MGKSKVRESWTDRSGIYFGNLSGFFRHPRGHVGSSIIGGHVCALADAFGVVDSMGGLIRRWIVVRACPDRSCDCESHADGSRSHSGAAPEVRTPWRNLSQNPRTSGTKRSRRHMTNHGGTHIFKDSASHRLDTNLENLGEIHRHVGPKFCRSIIGGHKSQQVESADHWPPTNAQLTVTPRLADTCR